MLSYYLRTFALEIVIISTRKRLEFVKKQLNSKL